LGAKITINS